MLLKQDYKGRDVDIFSLGVNLFLLMTRMPPWRYAVRNDPYYKYILADQIDMFWKKQTDRMRKEDDPSYEFDPDFKDLFLQMTTPNPQERIKLCDIIGHPWVTKNCADDHEVFNDMETRMERIKDKKRKESEQANENMSSTNRGGEAELILTYIDEETKEEK